MRSILLLGFFACSATISRADLMLGPDHFVNESIKAHGGDKIDKYLGEALKFEGKMTFQGQELDSTGEQIVQLPGQMKSIIRLQLDGNKLEFVTVVNGKEECARCFRKSESWQRKRTPMN